MMNPESIIRKQKDFFKSNTARPVALRIKQLKLLKQLIKVYEERLLTALSQDFYRPRMEVLLSEISICYDEIDFFLNNLKKWTEAKRVSGPMISPGSKGYISPEPYGVVLIIAPWNYPFQLAIYPLIGALAAGNCVVIKPSEYTHFLSEILAEMINDNFDNGLCYVYEGGADDAKELLEQQWDYIFYTGSSRVGKYVMNKAAQNLTPVTLELGGKCPCIVDSNINIKQTAKRIMWGKLVNAGQACISPDYLLVKKEIKDALLGELKNSVEQLYGTNIYENNDYCRLINKAAVERLKEYLKCGKVFFGGDVKADECYFSPTIMTDIDMDSAIMQDEIFGPILPVIEYSDISDAVDMMNSRPKPLALYVFSKNKDIVKTIVSRTSSGGVCINDTIVHVISPNMPFGGVGASGMGAYRGKKTFDTFTHYKSILKQITLFDLPFRYPPYTKIGEKIARFIKRQ
ncbi:MAG: aldehyde dehydrogenase [Candidatus Omnitrophica bacterium]|nr:aldehyde dehydrogenase [Candidatus Omnitrophota bacterium]